MSASHARRSCSGPPRSWSVFLVYVLSLFAASHGARGASKNSANRRDGSGDTLRQLSALQPWHALSLRQQGARAIAQEHWGDSCPVAKRISRWQHSWSGDTVRPVAFDRTFPLVCADGRMLGGVYVQPRVNPEHPEASDILISVDDHETQNKFNLRPCGQTFVFEDPDLDRCLCELKIPTTRAHLRQFVYHLPIVGETVRDLCSRLDEEEFWVQDALEALALLILACFALLCRVLVPRALANIVADDVDGGKSQHSNNPGFSPGTYRATEDLVVRRSVFGDKVGSIEAGTSIKIVEIGHHGRGALIFGRIAEPPGWVQLATSEGSQVVALPAASGNAPNGIVLPSWTTVFVELALGSMGFMFTLTSLLIKAFEILPKYSPSPCVLHCALAYPVIFGTVDVLCIWCKGCRYVTYFLALRRGKFFRPARSRTAPDYALWFGCFGYFYLAALILYVLESARSRGDIDFSRLVLEYWAFLALLIFNCRLLIFFVLKEQIALNGACVAHLADTVRGTGLDEEVICDIRFALPLLHESRIVAAGRSGSYTLPEQDLGVSPGPTTEDQAAVEFKAQDTLWFSSFVFHNAERMESRGRQLAKMWPLMTILFLAYLQFVWVGACMQRYIVAPELLQLRGMSGIVYPPFKRDRRELSIFVDKDAAAVNLYALADTKATSSVLLRSGHDSLLKRAEGSLLTRQLLSGDNYPPVLRISATAGPMATSYTLRVQPVFMVITAFEIRGWDCEGMYCVKYRRCVPWGMVAHGEISIPYRLEKGEIRLSVTEHILGIPVQRDSLAGSDYAYTTFERLPQAAQCRNHCKRLGSCVDFKATSSGCYMVHTHEKQACSLTTKIPRRVKYQSDISSAMSRAPQARICKQNETELLREDCIPMKWQDRESMFTLKLAKHVDWNRGEEHDLVVRSRLSINGLVEGDTGRELVTLRRGPPKLVGLLALAQADDMVAVNVIESSEPRLTVELGEYDPEDPRIVNGMKLYLSAIVSDYTYRVKWQFANGSEFELSNAAPGFSRCEADRDDFSRFQACGGEMETQTAAIVLNPWRPFQEHKIVIQPDRALHGIHRKTIPVTITTKNDAAPLKWLVRGSCHLPYEMTFDGRKSDDWDNPEIVAEVAGHCSGRRAEEVITHFFDNHHHHLRIPRSTAAGVLLRLGTNANFSNMLPRLRSKLPLLRQIVSLETLESAAMQAGISISRVQLLFEEACNQLIGDDLLPFVLALSNLNRPRDFENVVEKIRGRLGTWRLVYAAAVEAHCELCIWALTEILGPNDGDEPHLQSIEIVRRPLSIASLKALWSAIRAFEVLNSPLRFEISQVSLLDSWIPWVVQLIKVTRVPSEIVLHDTSITSAGLKTLDKITRPRQLFNLRVFNISNNNIGDDGLQALHTIVSSSPNLEVLDISGNHLSSDVLPQLVNIIESAGKLRLLVFTAEQKWILNALHKTAPGLNVLMLKPQEDNLKAVRMSSRGLLGDSKLS